MDRDVMGAVLRIVGEIAKSSSPKEIDRLRDKATQVINESKKKDAEAVAG